MFPFFFAHTFKYWVEDKYHGVRDTGASILLDKSYGVIIFKAVLLSLNQPSNASFCSQMCHLPLRFSTHVDFKLVKKSE